MRLFAIGDLHLPGADNDKAMSVFGPEWDNHFARIAEAWRASVTPEDAVLIPGDISWAMHLEDALPDLQRISELPGRKVMIRGNHDYWWSAIGRIRSVLPPGMTALQNDAVDLGETVVCGTRGWMIPTGETPQDPDNRRIYLREVQRLALSLDQGKRLAGNRPLVVMLHFPPLYAGERRSGFTDLMEQYQVQWCVYGHLHGNGIRAGWNGTERGIRYRLTSCDSLNFKPLLLQEEDPSPGPEEAPRLIGTPETELLSAEEN